MKRTLFVYLAVCLAAIVSAPSMAAHTGQHLRIASIKAYLFYHDTGTFGDVDIAEGKTALRNTLIGEGDAERPSSATLVLVTVVGCAACSEAIALEFKASADAKQLLATTVNLSTYFSDGKRIVVPFIVHGTGCEIVEIRAVVIGDDKTRTESMAKIPFVCGE